MLALLAAWLFGAAVAPMPYGAGHPTIGPRPFTNEARACDSRAPVVAELRQEDPRNSEIAARTASRLPVPPVSAARAIASVAPSLFFLSPVGMGPSPPAA